jgi:hypothetical protein
VHGHNQYALVVPTSNAAPREINTAAYTTDAPEQAPRTGHCSNSSYLGEPFEGISGKTFPLDDGHTSTDNDPATVGVPRPTTAQGRHDKRMRAGRGRLRQVTSGYPLQEQPSGTQRTRVYYTVAFSQLPHSLMRALRRTTADDRQWWAGARYCFVQPFLYEAGRLVEWRPPVDASSGDLPGYFRVAPSPDMLVRSPLQALGEQEAESLVRILLNPTVPARQIRVAPSYFLTDEMRASLAPQVSFPEALTLPEQTTPGHSCKIPEHLCNAAIEELGVSERTTSHLKQAGIARLGQLLEMEEEQLASYLDEEGLWETYVALCQRHALPEYSGIIPVTPPEDTGAEGPIFEEFYYELTGIWYDDPERGRLYLAHASVFADRLTSERSGPVETIWLSRAQVGQSLRWERDLERLEVHELRLRVNDHALARGARTPDMVPPDEVAWQRKRESAELEERYNLVPFRDELFVSCADLDTADAQGLSPTATVLGVLERYLQHQATQPIGDRLPVHVLQDMQYWIRTDRRRQWSKLPRPASPTMVMHEAILMREQRTLDESGHLNVQMVTELVGYRLIIGILATTPVPRHLIVEPRRAKPVFTAPARPIKPSRVPDYVLVDRVT